MSVGVPAVARPALEVRAVRIGVTAERTRLVLDLTRGRLAHSHSVLGDSGLVVRIPDAKTAAGFQRPALPDGLCRSLRIDRSRRGVLEVAVGFAAPAKAKVFSVDAEKGLPQRLVIDLEARRSLQPPKTPKSAREAPEAAPGPGPNADQASASVAEGRPTGPTAEAAPGAGLSSRPGDGAAIPVPKRMGPRVVIIDPGHGGADPGAVGKGVREKDVCLDVAKRLVAALNQAPGYRAVISRADDRRVALAERMRFAEREGADLFVSIHVNAARSSRASGAEVYFLSIGAATDRAAAELARLENEADPDFVVEEDEGLRGLPFAVDLRQSDTLLRSSRIAEVVLDVLTARNLAEPRGVKQAGFAVLKSYQVPSILVEVGFISSPSERKKLKSADHRQKLADALAAGVRRYFDVFAPARNVP